MSIIIATYKNIQSADLAVDHLIDFGVNRENISVAKLDLEQTSTTTKQDSVTSGISDAAGKTVAGAVSGGALGGVLGLLAGVAALSIPGLGGLLIAGPIAGYLGLTGIAATTVTGAGAGGAVGGIVGFTDYLINAGISRAEAEKMQQTIREGGVIISVNENQDLAQESEIKNILNKYNPQQLISV